MHQSQSDSGKTYPSVDQPLYAPASPYRPAKRVRRLLHDSKPETSLEKVFCEYDWHRQRFSSTLRDVSAPPHHSPRLPSQNISTNDKMIGGISSENLQDSSPGQQPFSSRTSCAVPRSSASQIPDETIVSKYLLSASPSSTPSALNLVDNDDPWVSNVFSTSPISQAEPTLSPLQQSIMAFAEQDRVALRADIHATPLPDRSPKKSRKRTYEDLCSSGSPHRQRLAPPAASFDVSPNPSPLRPSANNVRISSLQMQNALKAEAQSTRLSVKYELRNSFQYLRRPQLFLRRRSSAPEKSHAPPIVSKGRSSSESEFKRNSRYRVHFYDEIVRGDLEDEAVLLDGIEMQNDEDEQDSRGSAKTESRLAGLVAAIHYQYLAVGMRIQLAMHRTEKKVSRRLSGRRTRQVNA